VRALLKRADALGCEFIATGHYAKSASMIMVFRCRQSGRRYKRSDVCLWGLQQDLLKQDFVAAWTLPENRDPANGFRLWYPELAKKSESYEILFRAG